MYVEPKLARHATRHQHIYKWWLYNGGKHACSLHPWLSAVPPCDRCGQPKNKRRKGEISCISLNQSMSFGELSMACSLLACSLCGRVWSLWWSPVLFRMCTWKVPITASLSLPAYGWFMCAFWPFASWEQTRQININYFEDVHKGGWCALIYG